jgi:hypothetical protein
MDRTSAWATAKMVLARGAAIIFLLALAWIVLEFFGVGAKPCQAVSSTVNPDRSRSSRSILGNPATASSLC